MLLANHFDVKKIKKIFFLNPKCQLPITTKKTKKDSGSLHKKTYIHENHESQY